MTNDGLSRWIHDLKAPVTAIEGYTQLLLRGSGPLDEKQRRFIEGIGASCRVLFILLGNLKLERELEKGVVPRPTEFGELDRILERSARDLERAFAAKKAKVEVRCEPWTLRRGAEVVERTAANLLLSALHTSDEGAAVYLSAEHGAGELALTLSAANASGGGPGRGFDLSARMAGLLGGRSAVEQGRLFIAFPETVFV